MPRVSSHFSLQDPRFQSLVYYMLAPASIAADSNQTYTPAQVMGGYISRPTITTARTDTLPSAAAMCEAIQGPFVGLTFDFTVTATGGTLTVAVGVGGTLLVSGSNTIATTTLKEFSLMITNATLGSEAYTLISKGTSTV